MGRLRTTQLLLVGLGLVGAATLGLAWRVSSGGASSPAIVPVPAMASAAATVPLPPLAATTPPVAATTPPAATPVAPNTPPPPAAPTISVAMPRTVMPATSGRPVRAVPPPTRVAVGPDTAGARATAEAMNMAAWGLPAAPGVDPRRFTEAHWQGLEVIPKSPLVAQALKLPPEAKGVLVDDVTLPADLQGFKAGDLVTNVGGSPTPDLNTFIQASEALRDATQASVTILRDGQPQALTLTALGARLGVANGETPSMIPPGARMPHPYRGPCTNCHRIGTTGTLPVDQGDMLTTAAPVITVGAVRPHRDRGPCRACHQIRP